MRRQLLRALERKLLDRCRTGRKSNGMAAAMRSQVAESGVCVECRGESAFADEERAFEPVPHRHDERGRAAMARVSEVVEECLDPPWILAGSNSPAVQQRERDPRELKDIGLLVEPRGAGGIARRGEPEVLQSSNCQLQLIERGAEDVLDDHQSAGGCEDHAVCGQRRVRHVADVSLQRGKGGDGFSNEPRGERRMHTGVRGPAPEDLRHALARGDRRHEHEIAAVQTLDRTHLRERRMLEGVKRVDAVAQCVLEAGRIAQLRAKAE